MNIKSAICQGQARTIGDVVDVWKADHGEAMQARDAEDLVVLYHGYFHFVQEWADQAWEALFANQVISTQALGAALGKCLEQASALGDEVLKCVQLIENKGYRVHGADEFRASVSRAMALHADLTSRWPWLDEEATRRALAEYEAGKCRSLRTVLDELQRSGSANS